MTGPALLVAELSAPFTRATAADAVRIAREHWGIAATGAERVDTERDDTFRVDTLDGGYSLKLAHPEDDPAVVDLQVAAVAHALDRDPLLPLAAFLPDVSGQRRPVVDGRVARLSAWMPGIPLRDLTPGRRPLRALGALQARLAAALADFSHPAAGRRLAWDVQHLPELRPLLAEVDDPEAVAAVLDAWDSGRLAELPTQVVHNDANLDNVLVDPVTGAVTAILDFGDVVRTPRAIDLAVLASYLLPDDGDPASVVAEVVSGWESVLPLTADERGMLPILIAGRLAQRILIASWLSRATPENAGYARRTLALTRAQLVRFTEEF